MGETWQRPLIDSVTTPSPTPWGLAAGHYPLPRLPRPPQQRGSLALQNTLSMSDVPNPGVPGRPTCGMGCGMGYGVITSRDASISDCFSSSGTAGYVARPPACCLTRNDVREVARRPASPASCVTCG